MIPARIWIIGRGARIPLDGLSWEKMIHPVKDKSETDLLEEENRELIRILEGLGVRVLRPKRLSEEFIAQNYGKDTLAARFKTGGMR